MEQTQSSLSRELARLSALMATRLLDTPPEACFDRLTRLAAGVLDTPIALISLVDDRRQFFKSAFGLPEPWRSRRETPLSLSFCKHVVAQAVPLVVHDARVDPRVAGNTSIELLNVIAYLGVPLTTATGETLGAFCVIDHRPKAWTATHQQTMNDLAQCVMSEIALRTARDQLARADVDGPAMAVAEAGHYVHFPLMVISSEPNGPVRVREILLSENDLIGLVRTELDRPEAHGATRQIGLQSQREKLTARQRDVFDRLMMGRHTKDVAKELGLSPRTVEVHRAHILERLEARSFSQLLQELLTEIESH
jgi:DNA-binding CsgD family transcriptional regulator